MLTFLLSLSIDLFQLECGVSTVGSEPGVFLRLGRHLLKNLRMLKMRELE